MRIEIEISDFTLKKLKKIQSGIVIRTKNIIPIHDMVMRCILAGIDTIEQEENTIERFERAARK